ncbi:MAG TPA: aminotransferase class V-fold PLP-dependent enzyme [Candidatus Thermoplasmatota archaeon]|jgi:selenocysteine lyase/cysteine desulfurase|nr:aminotransferase class V-fold PLP-dependent enzyme [Candidatus Thermoplasmatota archaeon]
MADLSRYRDEFPTLRRGVTYLNSCSLGLLSVRTRAAIEGYMEAWTDLGASAWYEQWVGEVAALRSKVARLIGARPEEVAWAPSVSAALSTLASAMDFAQRDEVAVADLDFPTLANQFQVKPATRLTWVASPDGVRVPLDGWRSALGPRTALVATSRVCYTTGYLQDMAALGKLAHDAGARFLCDDYQATGVVPLDVRAMDCDFLVTGSLKWLMGGTGSCYLYVKRELLEGLAPTHTGWWANRHMFDFDTTKFAYWPDARRFEGGEVNMAGVAGASAALDMVLEIGPERLRAATEDLVRDLIERAEDAKFTVGTPHEPEQRGGIVVLRMQDPAKATKVLAHEKIIVDHRPGKLRVSPYFYNTPEDNARLIAALQRHRLR